MPDRHPDRATLAAFGTVVLLGSANIVAVRFSNRELAPYWGAALRFAVASLVMFAIVRLQHLPLPRSRSLRGAMIYGVLSFTAAYALFYRGAVDVPAGLAAVIMASVPLLTFFLALGHRLERFRWRGLAGAALAMGGVGVIAAEPPGGAIPGLSIALVFGAALCAAESGIVVKKIPESHPVTTNAVAMATGTVLLFALSLLAGEKPTAPTRGETWIALAYLALVGSPLLFVMFVYVLKRWTASAASYQFVLFPPVAILLAALLAGEEVTRSLLLGAPLVVAGVYVGALSGVREAASSPRRDVDIAEDRSSLG